MPGYIDLHMHTNFSDGLKSPSEILNLVRESSLEAFSITDHDSINGYLEAKKHIRDDDPKLISGIEFSVSFENGDLHMLAYGFDPENKSILNRIEEFKESRILRAKLMVEKLNELGVDITFEMIEEIANGASIGRPHVAEAIFKSGAVGSYEASFAKYIGNGKPGYVPKKNFTPVEAINVIHEAGGIAVLAHPVIDNNDKHIEMLAGLGMDGIEIYHPYHRQPDKDRLINLADRFRLIITGGSDYHGREERFSFIGSQKVPINCLLPIEQKLKERR